MSLKCLVDSVYFYLNRIERVEILSASFNFTLSSPKIIRTLALSVLWGRDAPPASWNPLELLEDSNAATLLPNSENMAAEEQQNVLGCKSQVEERLRDSEAFHTTAHPRPGTGVVDVATF